MLFYRRNYMHNLDLQTYSFQDLLKLFHLPENGTITIQDLKRAKMIVLKTHPDKSKLDAKYFLFYKKAFDIIVEFYQQQTKIGQEVTAANIIYNSYVENGDNSKVRKQVKEQIGKVDKERFQEYFHSMFEEMTKDSRLNSSKRNEWFTREDSLYGESHTNSVSEMRSVVEQVRLKQKNQQELAKYRGVEGIFSGNGGSNFYEEGGEGDDQYIAPADIFSRLKFDDLRKVHKDQTVLGVSEKEFVAKESLKEMEKQRMVPLKPLGNLEEMKYKEEMERKMLLEKAFESKKKTQMYQEKNKQVVSHFLRLR
jgi:hypothetical protein